MTLRTKIPPPYIFERSDIFSQKITFDELIIRIRAYIRLRISSGEYSERALARVLDVAQSHLHNMLKGKRQVSAEFADRVMLKFEISILDLISDEEVWKHCDEKNPNWLTLAAKRKPAAKSTERESDPRAPWRESILRSTK